MIATSYSLLRQKFKEYCDKVTNVFLLTVGIMIVVVILTVNSTILTPKLSQAQIEELRIQYPVYYDNPTLLSMIEPELEELIGRADAIIYAEVVDVLPEYNISLISDNNSPEGKVYAKGKEYGLEEIATFIQYKVQIIEDISDSFFDNNSDNTAIITVNSQFKGYVPELKSGMRIVLPVAKEEKGPHKDKYFFSKYGFYYITDNGYVLSAYKEKEGAMFNGKKYNDLKKNLKKMVIKNKTKTSIN